MHVSSSLDRANAKAAALLGFTLEQFTWWAEPILRSALDKAAAAALAGMQIPNDPPDALAKDGFTPDMRFRYNKELAGSLGMDSEEMKAFYRYRYACGLRKKGRGC